MQTKVRQGNKEKENPNANNEERRRKGVQTGKKRATKETSQVVRTYHCAALDPNTNCQVAWKTTLVNGRSMVNMAKGKPQ